MINAIMFTDDELRTLVSAINIHYNELHRVDLKAGKHRETETTHRLLDISKKAYAELIRRQDHGNV